MVKSYLCHMCLFRSTLHIYIHIYIHELYSTARKKLTMKFIPIVLSQLGCCSAKSQKIPIAFVFRVPETQLELEAMKFSSNSSQIQSSGGQNIPSFSLLTLLKIAISNLKIVFNPMEPSFFLVNSHEILHFWPVKCPFFFFVAFSSKISLEKRRLKAWTKRTMGNIE